MILPVWVEYARALGPTLVAAALLVIAYQQWKLARAGQREKLFDRRIKVLEAFDSMTYIPEQEPERLHIVLAEATALRTQARYLFGDDFGIRFSMLISDITRLALYRALIKTPVDRDEAEIRELKDNENKVSDRIKEYEKLDYRFVKKYLDLSNQNTN